MIGLLVLGAALGAGLVGGVFFAFSTFVMPALARLPAAQGIAAMQSINVTVLNRWFLGVFVGTAFACLVIAVRSLLSWSEPGARFAFAAALLYLVGNILVTRSFNIPRNEALALVSSDSAAAADLWRTFLVEWCFWNHVRGAAAFASSAAFILALIEPRRFVSHVVGAVFALGGLTGCNLDQVHPIAAPGTVTPEARLSLLGIFAGELKKQKPAPGFVAYDVNVPFYADGATKRRFVHVPEGTRAKVTADRWELPVGTYLVKTFSFPVDERDPMLGERFVETRFLVKTEDGFVESTYLWNAEQTDAVASPGNVDVAVSTVGRDGQRRDLTVHVPGTSECASCHEGRALGWRSRQLDVSNAYPDGAGDQIAHLVTAGVASGKAPAHDVLADPFGGAPLEARARSYLDVNCGTCHTEGGSAERTDVFWDLEHTQKPSLPACRDTSEVDGNDHVLVPGHSEKSEFLSRMLSADSSVRMPRGPSRTVDRAGYALLSSWVAAMSGVRCTS